MKTKKERAEPVPPSKTATELENMSFAVIACYMAETLGVDIADVVSRISKSGRLTKSSAILFAVNEKLVLPPKKVRLKSWTRVDYNRELSIEEKREMLKQGHAVSSFYSLDDQDKDEAS